MGAWLAVSVGGEEELATDESQMHTDSRSPFCKLANPASYVACSWDLSIEEPGGIIGLHFSSGIWIRF